MKRTVANLTLSLSIFSAGLTLFLLWFVFTYLFTELSQALTWIIYASGLTGVLLAIAALVVGVSILWQKLLQSNEDTEQKREQTKRERLATKEVEVRILVQTRIFHDAPPGYQVYQHDALQNVTTPLHLQPGVTNGHYIEPADFEVEQYRLNQLAHATARSLLAPNKVDELSAGTAIEPLRPILPILVQAQRAIIAGSSGAGKTTLQQWLVYERAKFSKVILLDPHGQRPKWGSLVEAIGCGMDFNAIDEALRAIDWLMVKRYEEIAAGAEQRSHPNVTLIIDELMAIVDEKQRGEAAKQAATVIKRLATQARKAAIDVFLIAHSLLVGQTGLKGASDLLSNFTVVELHKDLDDTRSCYLHILKPGNRKDLIECALPGPFDESRVVIRPEQLLQLPPAPTLEEITLIDAIRAANPGASFGEIARMVGLSNSTYTNKKIRAVIEKFGLESYEIGTKMA